MKFSVFMTLALLSLTGSLATGVAYSSEPLNSENEMRLEPKETRMLLNWAIHLSRYQSIDIVPEVIFVDHAKLEQLACFGRSCPVLGWYNDTDTIYIDDRFYEKETLFSRSLIVHELVHYLQHKSAEYSQSCTDVSAREAEAYWVQQEYHIANGTFGQIRRHYYYCDVAGTAMKQPRP